MESVPLPPPNLGTGTIALADPIRIPEPPRKAKPENDLRNFFARRRAASDEAAATSALAPPHRVRNLSPVPPTDMPAAAILPGAPRPSKLQRHAQDTPHTVEAFDFTPTLVPRAPVLPPVRPTSTSAALDAPGTRRPSRAQKRKNRRKRVYAQLNFERLTANPTMARTGRGTRAAAVGPPLPGHLASPSFVSPVGAPPPVFPVDLPPPAVAPPPFATEEPRPPTPPTPTGAFPAACAHLAASLGIADDEDPTASPDNP
jgi:hypothetical protein